MTKKLWIPMSLLVALVLFVGGFVLVSDQTRNSDPRGVVPAAAASPVSMIGTWTQTNTEGTTATAVISNGKISIQISDGDTSGLYWTGTFPVSSITSQSFSVTSTGDTAEMETSLLASEAKTKTFTYNNGVLSYEFSILGTTTTIHLQRSSE